MGGFTYEQQKESQPGRAGPESKDPGTPAGGQIMYNNLRKLKIA